MNEQASAKLKIIATMLLFGTIGIFVRYINMPSSVIALSRGAIGALFLLTVLLIQGKRLDRAAIRQNRWRLLFSGACIGINWMLLFESYRYTTVATATLCYYLQPVFVILASHFVLGEKLTARKLLCVLVAILGMVPVSGVLEGGIPSAGEITGILLAVGAAVLYAANIVTNKTMKEMPSYDMTIICMATAALAMLPYTLLTVSPGELNANPRSLLLLLTVCVVHSGVAYAMYYSALKTLKAQTVAMYGYIDPIFAIVLSAVLLKEPLTISTLVGAVMILGATFFSEGKAQSKTQVKAG